MASNRSHDQAFPTAITTLLNGHAVHGLTGMTLREYTAIAAMQGILANPNTSIKHDDIAHQAVFETDALLKKLKETS